MKQFTTQRNTCSWKRCCLYYCKDTLFEAIHNNFLEKILSPNVVCITAKIHFLKQFTTKRYSTLMGLKLFVLLQRYTFWSNSQRLSRYQYPARVVCITAKIHFLKQFTTLYCLLMILFSCLYYCKDTLFEAIHNLMVPLVVSLLLFVLLQRYTFWSNSQPRSTLWTIIKCCLYYCKDTLFEAIHNIHSNPNYIGLVVCITAKIHFLKQFTTTSLR